MTPESWFHSQRCLDCGYKVVVTPAHERHDTDYTWYCSNPDCQNHKNKEHLGDLEYPEWIGNKPDSRLWDDLETDQERLEFLRSGRAWETGIIAASMVDDIAEVYERIIRFEDESNKKWRKNLKENDNAK